MTEEEREKWDIVIGQAVEVMFESQDEGEEVVESWWEGNVVTEKAGFYSVHFPEEGGLNQTEVLEKSRLRPSYGHQPARFDKKVCRRLRD